MKTSRAWGEKILPVWINRRKTVQKVRWESVCVCWSSVRSTAGEEHISMNGIFVKGPIFSRDSSKRLCVCVPGFVHCKHSNKHSLCSGIKQHKPPLRKALQSTYVIYFCHACNSSLRNKMKQVKDTETIQKHHFAVSEWLPSQASDVAGIFRLNVS